MAAALERDTGREPISSSASSSIGVKAWKNAWKRASFQTKSR